MDDYEQSREQARAVPWSLWPERQRALLPVWALQRAARQLPVWFPPILYVEPTNACNANCVFCPRHAMTRPRGYMDYGLYTKLLDQAAQLGPSEIRLFHYGEPLLHPRLPDMVRAAREHGLSARFQTNGLYLPEPLIRDLLDAGMNYIGISVNGLLPSDYEAMRPGHAHADLHGNLIRLRKAIQASGRPCHIHLNAHVDHDEMPQRTADVQTFKKTWLLVADSLSISGLSRYDRVAVIKHGHVEPTDLETLLRKPDTEVCCSEPFDRLVVKWDGRASPCCADYDGRLIVGDLNRQTLEEVWNSEPLDELRKQVQARAFSNISLCRTCPKFYSTPYHQIFVRTAYQPVASGGPHTELI